MDGNRPHRKAHPQNNKHDSDWKKTRTCQDVPKIGSGGLPVPKNTWLLRKCFPILQSYWGGCRPPRPPALNWGGCRPPRPPAFPGGEGCRPPPQTPTPANYEGLRPSNSPQEIGKTIGAGLYYSMNEAHNQYNLLDTIFDYVFYFGPPGKYLQKSQESGLSSEKQSTHLLAANANALVAARH